MGRRGEHGRWADKDVFTTGEAAEVCSLSQQTIIRCFDSGRLKGFRVPGSRFRRIPRSELVRFMRDNSIPGDAIEGLQKRVLLIDADPERVKRIIEAASADERLEIREATTGYDAGILTERFRPHLVVVSDDLSDIDRGALRHSLRERFDLNDTAVLVIRRETVPGRSSDGAEDVIVVGPDARDLMARVSDLLGRRRPGDADRKTPPGRHED